MTTEHAQFVGTIPDYYDRNMGPVIFADYALDIAMRVAAFDPRRVLETACGTGIVTMELRRALASEAAIISTDLNPPMIERARAKFSGTSGVHFQQADAQELPFEGSSFDTVVCQFGVMFYPDKDKSYREVFRVLEPGGRYVFNVWDSHRYNAFARIGHALLMDLFPVNPPLFMTIPFSYSFEAAKDSLLATGFTNIECSVVRYQKTLSEPRHFAEGFVFGSPVADQIRARSDIQPNDVLNSVAAAFEGEFAGKPGGFGLQAFVFSATKPG